MAKTWQESSNAERRRPAGSREPEPEQQGLPRRLRDEPLASREALTGELRATFAGPLDDETWERLEEALIYADVGARTTAKVVERLEHEAEEGASRAGRSSRAACRRRSPSSRATGDDHIDVSHEPSVILTVGRERDGQDDHDRQDRLAPAEGDGPVRHMAAADTYRAAAQEQLTEWADRAGCEIVSATPGSDPGAVIFDAIEAARARGHDVVIADTAGRLHTQVPLMEELAKVRRVIEKQLPGAPHETLLTVDATTGQNGLRQAKLFQETVDVTGIVLTKLDGTAKGGIALAIAEELGLPVKLIGIGESLEDLRPFDPDDFARGAARGVARGVRTN